MIWEGMRPPLIVPSQKTEGGPGPSSLLGSDDVSSENDCGVLSKGPLTLGALEQPLPGTRPGSVSRAPNAALGRCSHRFNVRERAGFGVVANPHIDKHGIQPSLQEVDDLARMDSIPVALPTSDSPRAPREDAQQRKHASSGPRPRKGSGRRMGKLVLGLPHRALHDHEAWQQSVCLTELRERKRVPLAEQSCDAGCPYWIEAALARLHTGVGQEGAHVLRGNQEIEALDFRIAADGDERHDADDGAVVIDRRPPAVSVDGGSIRLDHVLADGVRVESGHLSLRGGCFLQGAPAEELVIPDHSREPEDVELVAELGLLICDQQSWIYAVLDFQQG